MSSSSSLPEGFEYPKDLTGEVVFDDHDEPKFLTNYSYVYQGAYKGELVAVKVLNLTGNLASMKRKLKREMVIWATVKHPNIYPFYGFVEWRPFGALVSPWSTKGDAGHFLEAHGESMPVADRIILWRGVLDGVAYLHHHVPILIHGDLRPGNVLIDENGAPRICDFGLARILLEEGNSGLTTTSEHTGTTRYLAPELVASEFNVYPTAPSDVYALGCLGLEFIFLQRPHSNRTNNLRGKIHMDLKAGVPPATGPPRQDWPSIRIWPLISKLWDPNPLTRPTVAAAVRMLELTTLTLPPVISWRIIDAVATLTGTCDASRLDWKERTRLLCALCRVSKAYRARVTPLLYRVIQLHLDSDFSSLYGLNEAMNRIQNNGINSETMTVCGYESFTKTVIININSDRSDTPYLQTLSMGVQRLVFRLTGLRTAIIRPLLAHPHGILNEPEAEGSLLTTLELQQLSISYLLDLGQIKQSLTRMQRLCIKDCGNRFYVRGYSGPFTPHAPTGLLLPHLQDIAIYAASHHDAPQAAHELLSAVTAWRMPCIKTLRMSLWNFSTATTYPLVTFLCRHGSLLHHLCLLLNHGPLPMIAEVFSLCGNLRSIELSIISFGTLCIPHQHLETIRLWWGGALCTAQDTNSHVKAFMEFKEDAQGLYPKLAHVSFQWRYIQDLGVVDASASFCHGTNFITIIDGRRKYRHEQIKTSASGPSTDAVNNMDL